MKKAQTISIAMATYNGARFIAEQLESLTRQTFVPAELEAGAWASLLPLKEIAG